MKKTYYVALTILLSPEPGPDGEVGASPVYGSQAEAEALGVPVVAVQIETEGEG